MSDTEHLLSAFVDAWNRGERPRVGEYLARVPEGPQREELAEQLETWLEVAPTPAYGDAARAAIRREPALARVLAAADADAGLWAALLPGLRRRAGWSVPELAARLRARLGLTAEQEPKTAVYLEELEAGTLDAEGVSRRLLDALGALLGAGGETLRDAARFAAPMRTAPAPLYRGDAPADEQFAQDLAALSAAALTPAGDAADEVDRLFTGGPDA